MSNLAKEVKYCFEENLSFLDVCKIVKHFGRDFVPSYFSFHSEVIKRDGYANNFNVTLKNDHNDSGIWIDVSSICFCNIDAKEALAKYQEVVDVLTR